MDTTMKHTQTKVLDSLLSNIIAFAKGDNNTSKHTCDGTIKNFNSIDVAAKLEITIIDNAAILTTASGNVEKVIGWPLKKLIGHDLLRLMNVKPDLINKTYQELLENSFAYKENTFLDQNGNEVNTQSILMWREYGKTLVEIVWRKQ